jgi:dolichyl-phosphate beta-glucosyltransferase
VAKSTSTPQQAPFLTIVIPAYNEERRILPTLHAIVSYLGDQSYSWNVLVVDDGSTDNTAALVQEFTTSYPQVSLLSIPHRGKGWAVRSGMLHTKAEYRFLCDADLSMPINQLSRFLPPQITQYDVVIGSRESPGARRLNEPQRRHLLGRLYNYITRVMGVRNISDTQCGFKCFRGLVADTLFSLQRIPGFAFDVEVLFLAQRMNMRLLEVPIDWYYEAESKVRPLIDGLGMIGEILGIRWRYFRGRYGLKAHVDKDRPPGQP